MPDFSRMAKWQGSFEYRRSDNVTVAASFATIEVRDAGGPGLKTLFQDEAGLIPQANPFMIDVNGWAEFFVRPPDGEFDIHVSAPAGEFASFTKSNVRAWITGRKKFAARDYADIYNALLDLIAVAGPGGTILVERDITLPAGGGSINLSGRTGIIIEGIEPDVLITCANGFNSMLVDVSGATRCGIRNLRLDGNGINQAVNSASVGVSMTNTTDCWMERVDIGDTISDAVVFEGSTDLRLWQCTARDTLGHGFTHGGGGSRAVRPYLTECRALSCGSGTVGGGYPRKNGFDFEPMADGMILSKCFAYDCYGTGYLLGSENSAAVYKDVQIYECSSRANNREGLASGVPGMTIFIQNEHTLASLENLTVEGGSYREENEAGLEIGGGFGQGQGPEIRNVIVRGVTCCHNERYGLRFGANVKEGRVEACSAYNNNDNLDGVGDGFSIQGTSYYETEGVIFDGCHSYDDRVVPRQIRGYALASGTVECGILNCRAKNNATANYAYANTVRAQFANNTND